MDWLVGVHLSGARSCFYLLVALEKVTTKKCLFTMQHRFWHNLKEYSMRAKNKQDSRVGRKREEGNEKSQRIKDKGVKLLTPQFLSPSSLKTLCS